MPSHLGPTRKSVRFAGIQHSVKSDKGPVLPTTHLPIGTILDTANTVFPFNVLHSVPMVALVGADALAFLVAMQQPSLLNRYTLLGLILTGIIVTKEAYDEFQSTAKQITN